MTVKDNDCYVSATATPSRSALGRVIARGVFFCAIAACLFSCPEFGGVLAVIDMPDVEQSSGQGVVWLGSFAGHSKVPSKWEPLQKDYMYKNTIDNGIYKHDGNEWTLWVEEILPVIKTNIMVDGDYIPQVGDYFPVLMVFTDGSSASGYISSGVTATGNEEDVVQADIGKVILYDDYWNNGDKRKAYHTLTVLDVSGDGGNENILIGRPFATDAVPPDDVVLLKIDAQRKLQPREERVSAPDDPLNPNGYIPIHTVEELMWINRDITNGTRDGKYLQMGDLDLLGNLSSNVGTPKLEKHNWEPLGGRGNLPQPFKNAFKGTFDGNGKEIRNMYVNITDYDNNHWGYGAGLFRCVDGGTLRNITIASGSVTASYNAGGIVGRAKDVTITGCVNNAGITTTKTDASSTTDAPAGGIAGKIDSGTNTITNCGNTGSITVKNDRGQTGGIAGYLNGTVTISKCFNRGEVDGYTYKDGYNGGIAGYISASSTVDISACYNTGMVYASQSEDVGGLVGQTQGTVSITASYNASEVVGTGPPKVTSSWFIGRVNGTSAIITNCYYLDLRSYHLLNALKQYTVWNGGSVTENDNVPFDSAKGWPTAGVPGWDKANWKSLGNWIEGDAPDPDPYDYLYPDNSNGFNSNFPKLDWEQPLAWEQP